MKTMQNPMSSGVKWGLGLGALAVAGGAAYYFLIMNRNKPTGLKITGYQNLSAIPQGPIVKAPLQLSARQGDTIRIYVEFSYVGRQRTGVTLHAGMFFATGTELSDRDQTIILNESGLMPESYKKTIDMVLREASPGVKYNLQVSLQNMEGIDDIVSPAVEAALSITGTDPPPPANDGFWKPAIIPVTTGKTPVGGKWTFKAQCWYKGRTQNYKYYFKMGKIGFPGFSPKYVTGEGDITTTPLTVATLDVDSPTLVTAGPFTWTIPDVRENLDIEATFEGMPGESCASVKEGFANIVSVENALPGMSISPLQIFAGESIKVKLVNCTPNTQFQVAISPGGYTTSMSTNADGDVEKDITIGPEYAAGTYEVTATAGAIVLQKTFTIAAHQYSAVFVGDIYLTFAAQGMDDLKLPATWIKPTESAWPPLGIKTQTRNISNETYDIAVATTITRPNGSVIKASLGWLLTDPQTSAQSSTRDDPFPWYGELGLYKIKSRIVTVKSKADWDWQYESKWTVLATKEVDLTIVKDDETATLTVTPYEVQSGGSLTAIYAGFTSAASKQFYIDSVPYGSPFYGDGSGTQVLIILSSIAPGVHELKLVDSGKTATAAFSVKTSNVPQITLYPTILQAGDSISLYWEHFQGDYLYLYLDDDVNSYDQFANNPGGTGNRLYPTYYLSIGTHRFTLKSDYYEEASQTFEITSNIDFPAPGTPGDGLWWYWVIFNSGEAMWVDQYSGELYRDNPDYYNVTAVYGPYASGATG